MLYYILCFEGIQNINSHLARLHPEDGRAHAGCRSYATGKEPNTRTFGVLRRVHFGHVRLSYSSERTLFLSHNKLAFSNDFLAKRLYRRTC